jgi:hypothetical protein
LASYLQIYTDPVPDQAYHFDIDPDANFYLMRIQVTKMKRIWINNAAYGKPFRFFLLFLTILFTQGDKEEPVAPWSGYQNPEDLREKILALSADSRNFLRAPPGGVNFDLETSGLF